MGFVRDNLLLVSGVTLLVSGLALTLVLGYAVLVTLAALTTGAGLAVTVLDLFVPVGVLAVVLTVLVALSGVGVTVGLVRKATEVELPRDERLAALASRLERRSSLARTLSVSDHLAPTHEERVQREIDAVKERYVEGDISRAEFERRLEDLTGAPTDGERVGERRTDRGYERERH